MRIIQTLDSHGRKFILVAESEYRRLHRKPTLMVPPIDSESELSLFAPEAVRSFTALQIIEARKAVGLSQAELARRAGINVGLLNRIEKERSSATDRTLELINAALIAARGAGKRGMKKSKGTLKVAQTKKIKGRGRIRTDE
jgi:DNA-binding transcriptional regulator YiaG